MEESDVPNLPKHILDGLENNTSSFLLLFFDDKEQPCYYKYSQSVKDDFALKHLMHYYIENNYFDKSPESHEE
jgi:hypothetical protein